jgi:HNH endonuclease
MAAPGEFSMAVDTRAGWATHTATNGEQFWAIWPSALSALVVSLRDDAPLPISQVRTAIQSAGALRMDDEAKERTRLAATRLARSASFRSRVLAVYGEKCALCEMGQAFLLEAAHILPASLPGSSDVVSNGMPVCLYHHALLDQHLLYIKPDNLTIEISPTLLRITNDRALAALLASTEAVLQVPESVDVQELRNWLQRRYDAFRANYDWCI